MERDVSLQIRSIIDIAFFFDTRQAIEKTTNLHYNLFICFIILDHIHFFIDILFIRMDLRHHFCQLKLIAESSAFAFQPCKAVPFLNNG